MGPCTSKKIHIFTSVAENSARWLNRRILAHLQLKIFFSVLFISSITHSAILIPTGMSSDERKEVVRILGWGTSSKLLTDPFPLGGYSGFEAGLAVESVPVDAISYLGNKTGPQDRFTFPKLTIGKGLYYNIDAFIHFIPFTESTGLSEFGGLVKWSIYQATHLPATFGILLHGNSSNVGDQFVSQSVGMDLVTGLTFNQFSFFLGGGEISSTGQFMPTGTGQPLAIESTSGFHSLIGCVFHFDPIITVFQLDQYADPVLSMKMGVRY